MTLKKKTNADIIIATIISFCFIAFVGFIFIFAKSEGTLGDGYIINFIADYIIYLFPFILLYEHFKIFNFNILLIVAGLNILFYSLVLTRLFSKKLMNSERYKPYKLTIIVAYVIPSIFLVYVIFLIATSR